MIDDHRAEIGSQQLRAVVTDERREICAETDRGVIHEILDHLQHRVGDDGDAASDRASPFAKRLETEAEEDREEDQRQHRPARKQIHKVVGREGLDYLVRRAEGLYLARGLHLDIGALRRREEGDGDEHQDGSDGSRDQENDDQRTHYLSETLHRGHRGNGAADRRKDQRHDHHKHRVDKEVPKRFEHQGVLAHHRADDTADRDGAEKDYRETVRLPQTV